MPSGDTKEGIAISTRRLIFTSTELMKLYKYSDRLLKDLPCTGRLANDLARIKTEAYEELMKLGYEPEYILNLANQPVGDE